MGNVFLGSIKRDDEIPINLTLDTAPTGTPTYEIMDSSRTEIVAAASLTQGASTLEWYKTGQTVDSDATEGEYSIRYTAVVNGVTRYIYDSYEVPPTGLETTAGDTDWTLTREQIIQQVLEINNAIAVGDTPTTVQTTSVSTVLNQFIKWLQKVHDIKLWKLDWATKKFSDPDEVTGTDSNVYTCIRSHTSSTDDKPITGDDWTTYWTKEGSTGGTWATSTAYTSAGDFTDSDDLVGIERAFIRKNDSGTQTDLPMEVIGYNMWMDIPNKNSFGIPIQIWYDNKISPTIYINPQLEDTDDYVIHYLKIKRIEDFDTETDTPDFPVEWIEPIVWNVAYNISFHNDVPVNKQRMIKEKAESTLKAILARTREYSDKLKIMPNLRR
jgi:hypothetical protein